MLVYGTRFGACVSYAAACCLITVMVMDDRVWTSGLVHIEPRGPTPLLQSNTKQSRTKWFMSDLAEQFYSAWVSTFTSAPPPNRLLCVWYVDRVWRENLKQFETTWSSSLMMVWRSQFITISEHCWRGLMCTKFELLLASTLEESSSTTEAFAGYYNTY